MQQPENGRWADAQVAEIVEEPYYVPVGDEVEIFETAYAQNRRDDFVITAGADSLVAPQ